MNLDNLIVSEDTIIAEAIKIIDLNARNIVFVCHDNLLRGVISDGDIRRHILKNGDLKETVKKIANYEPKYIKKDQGIDPIAFMKKHSITAVPIVDESMHILSVNFLYKEKAYKKVNLNNEVVIMAGGKGTRLYPYTNILPKPLIPIGEKTITEYIMDKFELFGCNKFSMILNYKKNLIKSFFIDNEVQHNIEFIEEHDYLGTGGGLRLIKDKCKSTFFMTNCDILVDADYSKIIEFHKAQENIITIISAIKNIIIPYGTIEMTSDGKVNNIKEKPDFSFLTNTGLYVIEPDFIDKIPDNTFIHITDIIQKCIDKGENVGVYPVSENAWMDMGQLEELENMKEKLSIDI